MATGHILPGHKGPITTLRLSKSAGYGPRQPLDTDTMFQRKHRQFSPHADPELAGISQWAKEQWRSLERTKTPTSYSSHFGEKSLDEPTKSRPSSPTRRNKPHPPLVFLACRLHHVPGYHNADAALGKSVYRVDGSLAEHDRMTRRRIRNKYSPRPTTAAVNQYTSLPHTELQDVLPAREAQAAEAWIKLSDGEDRDAAIDMIKSTAQDQRRLYEEPTLPGIKDQAVPSLHRWLKKAGAEETEAIGKLLNTVQSNPNIGPNRMIPYQTHSTYGQRIDEAKQNMSRVFFRYKPHRGDFLLHPDWPPTLRAHKLPDWPPHNRHMPGPM